MPMLEINDPEVVAEVTEAFQRYERALVANDVAALDGFFWNNPNTLRFGIAENLYGHAAIASFRSSRPPINLTRQLKNTVIVSYGRDFATANTEFQRAGSTLTGRQSHVWVRTEDGWRIAAAHVSLMPAQPRETVRNVADTSTHAFGTS
jgi:ketosteroid isomerase-like protein